MHQVIPLDSADAQTVQDMAEAAADNGYGPDASPYPSGHEKYDLWLKHFHRRERALLETLPV